MEGAGLKAKEGKGEKPKHGDSVPQPSITICPRPSNQLLAAPLILAT
jgi:hypothetical protein